MRRLAAAVAVVLLTGCTTATVPTPGPASDSAAPVTPAPATPAPTPTPTPAPATCRAEAEELSLAEQAGQLVMAGVTGGLDASEKAAITKPRIGSVILMGTSERGAKQTARLTDRIQELADAHGILVAVDQEGGLVQRLKGPGFDTMPSAAKQAKLGGEEFFERTKAWGSQLARAGVQLNLAPVADVVPKANVARNEPIAKLGRGYGTDPDTVSDKVQGFIYGMHLGGVGTAVKHFPGLGAVTGNTDFAAKVVDSTTTADSDLLQPFRAALRSGTDAVMISSAVYSRIDSKHRAVYSAKVIGILRGWGFDGVVISDDLGAAKAVQGVDVKQRASRFIAAGGDLAVTVTPELAGAMVSGIVARAEDDPDFAERVTESAARVLALKQAYGLTTCG